MSESRDLDFGSSKYPIGKRCVFRSGEDAIARRFPIAVRVRTEAWRSAIQNEFQGPSYRLEFFDSADERFASSSVVWVEEFSFAEIPATRDLDKTPVGYGVRLAVVSVPVIGEAFPSEVDRTRHRNLLLHCGYAAVFESVGQRGWLRRLVEAYFRKHWVPDPATIEQQVENNLPW